MTTEHRHAKILRLIADGKVVQVRHMTAGNGSTWCDMNTSVAFSIFPEFEYREKPKPKVKKWRWVFKHIDDESGILKVTSNHYQNQAEVAYFGYTTIDLVEKVESTMIEVEE